MPIVVPLVFVSSTREDLLKHREAAQHAILGLDILYRGMEYFGSRAEKPRNVMLDELVQCDLYLGIIGLRYGSIDSKTHLSFTELEYRKACAEGIPTLMFLMTEEHPVPESHKDATQEARDKLRAFRQAVKDALMFEWFTTPDDLAAKMTHSLESWLAKNGPAFRRMRTVPLKGTESEYVRKLHSRQMADVKDAIDKLGISHNRLAHEHLYAALHRPDLSENAVRRILIALIQSPDQDRVAEMVLSFLEDVPKRRKDAIFAIGHRAMIDDRVLSHAEVSGVLNHGDDSESAVREEVAHALGKILIGAHPMKSESHEFLVKLREDPDPGVSARARQALERAPEGY